MPEILRATRPGRTCHQSQSKHPPLAVNSENPFVMCDKAVSLLRNLLDALTASLVLTLAPLISIAATFPHPPPGDSVVGRMAMVELQPSDTLVDLARRYGVGYQEMKRSNPGVNLWVPSRESAAMLPTRFVLPAVPIR